MRLTAYINTKDHHLYDSRAQSETENDQFIYQTWIILSVCDLCRSNQHHVFVCLRYPPQHIFRGGFSEKDKDLSCDNNDFRRAVNQVARKKLPLSYLN